MSGKLIILILLLSCSSLCAQVTIPFSGAYKYPKVVEIKVPLKEVNDTLFDKKYYILSDSIKDIKVGRFIEYGSGGSISRMGYYSVTTDTFSIDSQTIIIFSNPHKHTCIRLHYSLIPMPSFGNTYAVSESGACTFEYGENGKILEECVEMPDCTIQIIYGKETITYKTYRNQKVVESREIKNERSR